MPQPDRAALEIRASNATCPHCRYDVRAHKPGDKCPECGNVIALHSPTAKPL